MFLGFISANQAAPIIAYEFENDEQEQLFNRLSNEAEDSVKEPPKPVIVWKVSSGSNFITAPLFSVLNSVSDVNLLPSREVS